MIQVQIAPSLLSLDLSRASETVSELIKVGAEVIHLDIMDGQFVPPITFGHHFVQALPKFSQVLYEAHLMTLTPERHFQSFVDAGCKRIIFHLEVTTHPWHLAKTLKEMGCQVGIALNPGTAVELIRPLVEILDLVLIMTVNPGWGGQKFLQSCLDKVHKVKQWAPHILIELDGGLNEKTIPLGVRAGAELMVVGSRFIDSKGFEHVWHTLQSSIH